MAKPDLDLREELAVLRCEAGLLQRQACSREENRAYQATEAQGHSLPEGVFPYRTDTGERQGQYYAVVSPQALSWEERLEYLLLRQLRHTRTIRSCAVLVAALAVLSAALSLLALLR